MAVARAATLLGTEDRTIVSIICFTQCLATDHCTYKLSSTLYGALNSDQN